jgi:mRNA interferase MazF
MIDKLPDSILHEVQSAAKKRAAIAVNSSAYNSTSPDIVIMAATSQMQKSTAQGECIIIDWRAAGLLKPLAIKSTIATIEQRVVF